MNHDRQSIVYAVQNPMIKERRAFDFSPAEKYGRVKVVCDNGKDILTPAIFEQKLIEELHDYDYSRDFIIAAGDYSVILTVGAMVGAMHGRYTLLRWIPAAADYQPITFDFRPLRSR
jgi:hypothetical protein